MIGPSGFGQAPNVGVGRGLAVGVASQERHIMTRQQCQEHERLQRAWSTGKATKKQIVRCMELDCMSEFERAVA